MLKRLLAVGVLATLIAHAAAKGPVGVGKLEIGMGRKAIEALTAEDGTYLSAPMTPFNYKYIPQKAGEDMFDAQLTSPLSEKPLKVILTFSEDALKSLFIDFTDSAALHDRVKDLITSRYGEGKVENSMKEEQCIYRNGSNFKITAGTIKHEWTQERHGAEAVLTKLSDTAIETCPSDLRYATRSSIRVRNLTLSAAKQKEKQNNPF